MFKLAFFVSFTAVMISNMFRLNRADKQTAQAVLLGCKTFIFTIINYHYWQGTEILEYYAFLRYNCACYMPMALKH